jgi:hypothetical protein
MDDLLPHELHRSACECGDASCARSEASTERAGWLAALAPVVACAFCPACLSLYAKVASAIGTGLAIGEEAHAALLGVALTVSLGAALWRFSQTKRRLPLLLSVLGAALVGLAHTLGEVAWLEWSGMALLLASAAVDRWGSRGTRVAAGPPRFSAASMASPRR